MWKRRSSPRRLMGNVVQFSPTWLPPGEWTCEYPPRLFWDRAGEAGEGESARVGRTQPEPRRRLVALLIGGHDDCKSPLSLVGLFPAPPSASWAWDLAGEGRCGPWAVAYRCVGWSGHRLRRTCLYLVRASRVVCQSSASLGVEDLGRVSPWCWIHRFF